MSSTQSYVEFVCESINQIGDVRYRKMFGDYMVYLNDKPIFLICDNTVYIKEIEQLVELKDNFETGVPYDGAKEHYILDIENTELTQTVAVILEKVIPIPKPKKKNHPKK